MKFVLFFFTSHRSLASTRVDELRPISAQLAVIFAVEAPLFHNTSAILWSLNGPAHTYNKNNYYYNNNNNNN